MVRNRPPNPGNHFTIYMKSLAVLVSFFCFVAPLKAFLLTSVMVYDYYEQLQPDSLEHDKVVISGTVFGNDPDTAESATIQTPSGSMALTSESYTPFFFSAIFNDIYETRSEIENGNYVVQFFGGSLDGQERVYEMDTSFFPRALPKLNKHSYLGLSTTPVSREIRLMFPPLHLPKGASNAYAVLSINEQGANELAFSLQVGTQNPTVVIPANTLKPGALYHFTLAYIVNGPATVDGLFDSVVYLAQNHFTFTSSSVTNP